MKKYIVKEFNDRGDLYLASIDIQNQKEKYIFDSLDEAKELFDKEVKYLQEMHERADSYDMLNGSYRQVALYYEKDDEYVDYIEMSDAYKL